MRNSIADALSTREPPTEEGVDRATGMFSANKDALRRRIGNVPGMKKAGVTAGQTGSAVKKAGSKAKNVGIVGARKAAGTESIDAHRKRISESMDAATEADANRQFLTGAYQAGELDITEAVDRGLLTEAESPAEGVSTVSPDAAGRVTYPATEGGEATININDRAQQLGEQAHTLREDASKSARSIKRIRTAQAAAKAPGHAAVSTGRAGKRVGSTGVQTGKAGGVVFAGAMTQNPWAAYQIGKRGGKNLIGPGANPSEDASEDVDMEQSAELHTPKHTTEASYGDTAGGEATETR
jgi:type IV secretion system protein TrbL